MRLANAPREASWCAGARRPQHRSVCHLGLTRRCERSWGGHVAGRRGVHANRPHMPFPCHSPPPAEDVSSRRGPCPRRYKVHLTRRLDSTYARFPSYTTGWSAKFRGSTPQNTHTHAQPTASHCASGRAPPAWPRPAAPPQRWAGSSTCRPRHVQSPRRSPWRRTCSPCR